MTRSIYKPAIVGFCLIVTSIIVAVVAPMGSRIGWWNYGFAVKILTWSAYGGILASLFCLAGLYGARPGSGRRGFFLSLLGLIVIVPAIALLAYWNNAKQSLPPIQDITTDTINPPRFWYAPNAREYGGAKVAAQQRKAYPDIKPLILSIPVDQAFERALAVIRDTGWKLVSSEPDEGRIEATESTFWFGFSDDIVIRIRKAGAGSRIDVRSTSRFGGGGDGGTNARRVRRVLREIQQKKS